MKTPKLTTQAQLDAISEHRDIVKGTVGMVVMRMLETGADLSRDALMSKLESCAAAGSEQAGMPNGQLARGALRFIANLPSAQE